jgi:hypothetical protein
VSHWLLVIGHWSLVIGYLLKILNGEFNYTLETAVTIISDSGFSALYFSLKSLLVETYFSSFFSMRGGSRNAIAKKRTPIDRAKIKMYATLSMSKAPAYPVINNSLPSYMSKRMKVKG